MRQEKIYVAGHKGMVGSALVRQLKKQGYDNLVYRSRNELDLADSAQVEDFMQQERPDWVFLAAAKVGGILGNSRYPVEFLLDNLKIQNNVLLISALLDIKNFASWAFAILKISIICTKWPKNGLL